MPVIPTFYSYFPTIIYQLQEAGFHSYTFFNLTMLFQLFSFSKSTSTKIITLQNRNIDMRTPPETATTGKLKGIPTKKIVYD